MQKLDKKRFVDGQEHREDPDVEQQGNDADTIPLSSAPPKDASASRCGADPLSVSTTARSSSENRAPSPRLSRRALLFCVLIMLLGCGAAAAFIGIGLSDMSREQDVLFDRQSSEIVDEIVTTFNMFEHAALYVHNACRDGITHEGFFEVYQHVNSTGLPLNVLSFLPNTTHDERLALENETRGFYQENYPETNYSGFSGFHVDPIDGCVKYDALRPEQAHYFPIHFAAPLSRFPLKLDFDLYSFQKETIDTAIQTWKPVLTPRLNGTPHLLPEQMPHGTVLLLHPGIPLESTRPDLRPRDLVSVAVNIGEFLRFATRTQVESTQVFVYDSTECDVEPDFLSGITVVVDRDNNSSEPTLEDEVSLQDLQVSRGTKQKKVDLHLDGRKWTLVVLAVPGTYQPNRIYIILGGILILAACLFIVAWLFATLHREAMMNRMRHAAEVERAAMMIENANMAAKMERELNDFIAHEVRNPLSAAISACTFVSSALKDEANPLIGDRGTKQATLEDVHIIESSLSFIDDILRDMLDMQRAKSSQLTVDLVPTDIKREVLQLVDAMLYTRGDTRFQVQVECQEDFIVMTDRMRLKQILLNLGRNALKVVERGFVRLRSALGQDGNVCIFVEDSGPGIPADERDQIFESFHGRLGSPLNQGTGLGLSLCKKLTTLMGAEITYDETYNSGLQGCPGTRFVIDLCQPPLQVGKTDSKRDMETSELSDLAVDVTAPSSSLSFNALNKVDVEESRDPEPAEERALPETFSVLFVDDDKILRKLFIRAVKKVAPGWNVQEAASGEEALQRVEQEEFDLIFLDQYMTSVEKQLLGTETAREFRARGVTSMICGLSANNTEKRFLEAGANAFMIKPFPCEKESLKKGLLHLLQSGPLLHEHAAKTA